MPEETMETVLGRIEKHLQDIRAILTLVHQDQLSTSKKRLLKEGSIKRQIYDLCDGTRTTKEISDSIGKELPYVNSYISMLRREGLVRTVDKGERQIHEQIF